VTSHKHLKQLVRARMTKTGERYAAARRQLAGPAAPSANGAGRWHLPGRVPAATALRVLLAQAGVTDPRTGKPFTEAMVFGLGGGIGAGVFSFYYPKEDLASFFIAGRHLWQDDEAWLRAACRRLGVKPVVKETTSARAGAKMLRDALGEGHPVIAWVDLALLPHRGLPPTMQGAGYHVITVYSVDDDAGTALIGDLSRKPIAIPLEALAASRARIRSQKHRLLWIEGPTKPVALASAITGALSACREGLLKGRMWCFTLDAFGQWADRVRGSKAKDSWHLRFPPGPHLLGGLRSAHEYIEYYGSGGGLCRPLFAEFLREAGVRGPAADQYADLGRAWSRLADELLPDEVPLFRSAKQLMARRARLRADGAAPEELLETWSELSRLQQEARVGFPLDDIAAARLRLKLAERIAEIHRGELNAVRLLA
jgi:butirosin biosynthesis protein H-like/uncharacterized protein DUF4872